MLMFTLLEKKKKKGRSKTSPTSLEDEVKTEATKVSSVGEKRSLGSQMKGNIEGLQNTRK